MNGSYGAPVEVLEERNALNEQAPWSFGAYLALQDERDLRGTYEFEDGLLVLRPVVDWGHERLASRLRALLGYHAEGRRFEVGGSPFELRSESLNVARKPDAFAFVPDGGFSRRSRCFSGAPHLVLEVASGPADPTITAARQEEYLRLGAAELWVVFCDVCWADRSRFLAARSEGWEDLQFSSGILQSESLPDFHVRREWLWSDDQQFSFSDAIRELRSRGA